MPRPSALWPLRIAKEPAWAAPAARRAATETVAAAAVRTMPFIESIPSFVSLGCNARLESEHAASRPSPQCRREVAEFAAAADFDDGEGRKMPRTCPFFLLPASTPRQRYRLHANYRGFSCFWRVSRQRRPRDGQSAFATLVAFPQQSRRQPLASGACARMGLSFAAASCQVPLPIRSFETGETT